MFSRLITRTTLVAAIAAVLLVPAAQADDWARDQLNTVDPAIAAAIHDRSSLTPAPAALDPAIQTALFERASSMTRPDDRAGSRGPGSLNQPEQVASGGGFDWSTIGVGMGATLAALLAFGSLLAARHVRARVTNA